MSLSPAELEGFLAGLVGTPELWQHRVRHDRDIRVYEQLSDDKHVNAWLICWSEDQDTGFHDHDESAAAISVIEGAVREERLRFAATPDTRVIGPGATFFVPLTAIHRVPHEGTASAVTIHAYSPPLRRTGAYTLGPGGELERAAKPYEQELRVEAALS